MFEVRVTVHYETPRDCAIACDDGSVIGYRVGTYATLERAREIRSLIQRKWGARDFVDRVTILDAATREELPA